MSSSTVKRITPSRRDSSIKSESKLFISLAIGIGAAAGFVADRLLGRVFSLTAAGLVAGFAVAFLLGRRADFRAARIISIIYIGFVAALFFLAAGSGFAFGPFAAALLAATALGAVVAEGFDRVATRFVGRPEADDEPQRSADVISLDIKRKYFEEITVSSYGRYFNSPGGKYKVEIAEEEGPAKLTVTGGGKLSKTVFERYFSSDEWFLEDGIDSIICRFSADEKYLAITAAGENPIEVYRLSGGAREARITGLKGVTGVDFGAGKSIVISAGSGEIVKEF